MLQATAEWRTMHGSKYLVQLCKHFAHKIEVSHDETHGECPFSCGTATLDADENGLRITATATDEGQLVETEAVIERHLVRFAFRENLTVLQWERLDRAA